MRRLHLCPAVLVLALIIAGCGDDPPPPGPPPSPEPAGCSEFCAQAGPVAGDDARSTQEVLGCRHTDYACVEQVTTSAEVTNDVVSIDLACHQPDTCVGAVVVYSGVFKRLGGADFVIDSGETSTVDVGLVDNWQELIAAANIPDAATFIWLNGPGDEPLIDGGKSLSLTQAP